MGCGVSYTDTTRYHLRRLYRNTEVSDRSTVGVNGLPVQTRFCSNAVEHGLLPNDNDLVSDVFNNNGESVLLKWKPTRWADIKVGNIVRIKCGHYLPADMLFLYAYPGEDLLDCEMGPGGAVRRAFFDTSMIDGVRHALRVALYVDFIVAEWDRMTLEVECENEWVHRKDNFRGRLKGDGFEEALTSLHILPRYAYLSASTSVDSIVGLVLFTGLDTYALREYENTLALNRERGVKRQRAQSVIQRKGDRRNSAANNVECQHLLIMEPEGTMMSRSKGVLCLWVRGVGMFRNESKSLGGEHEWHQPELQNSVREAFSSSLSNPFVVTPDTEIHLFFLMCIGIVFDSTLQLSKVSSEDASESLNILTSNEMDRALLHVAKGIGCSVSRVGPPCRVITVSFASQPLCLTILEVLDFSPSTERQVFVGEAPNGEVWVLCRGIASKIIPLLKPKYRTLATTSIDDVGPGQIVLCAFRRFINREEYDRARFLSRPDEDMRLCATLSLSHMCIPDACSIFRDVVSEKHLALRKAWLLSKRSVFDLKRWCHQFGILSESDSVHCIGLTHVNEVVLQGDMLKRVREIEQLKDTPQLHTPGPYCEGDTIQFECCNKRDFVEYVKASLFTEQIVFVNNINFHMNGEESDILAPLIDARLVIIARCHPLQKAAYVRILNLTHRTTVIGSSVNDVYMAQEASQRGSMVEGEQYLKCFGVHVVPNIRSAV